jgi:hypothetical protein
MLRNAFYKSRSMFQSSNRRLMSSDAPVDSSTLAGAVGTTFVTYMLADYLSNFLQHPTQKVSERVVSCMWYVVYAAYNERKL